MFLLLFYYDFWSRLPSLLFLLLPRLGLAVIWPPEVQPSGYCPAFCLFIVQCHCRLPCIFQRHLFLYFPDPSSAHHIRKPTSLRPDETLWGWSQPLLRYCTPHLQLAFFQTWLLPQRWFHATSLCSHCVPLPCHGNLGTKWKMSIPGDYIRFQRWERSSSANASHVLIKK